MISNYDVQDAEEPGMGGPGGPDEQIPHYESEFMNAKMFLQLASTNTGDNLYDHLCETLNKILAERPQNVIDFFEEYSRRVKEKRFKPMTDHLEDIFIPPSSFTLANKMMPLLRPLPPGEPSTIDPADLDFADMSQNNMLELLFYFEHCSLGLPRPEMFYIMLSIRKLIHTEPISSIRFWGKIFGTIKNYIILECELKSEEYMRRNETFAEEKAIEEEHEEAIEDVDIFEENRIRKALDEIAKQQQFFGEGSKYPRPLPPVPIIHFQQLPEAPSEPSGVGVNKMVYYVSSDIGEPWVQLPDITPKHIQVSRQIYKAFTGNLEESVLTYPEFPGKEKDYLRAQIARISAGTQIAPHGYFIFGEGNMDEDADDDEIEEAPGSTNYRKNPRYEAPPLKDLLDPSMSFWVHQTQYILPQGRTTWWNPNPIPDGLGEEMDEEYAEEEEEEITGKKPTMERVEPEHGPPLLTPLAEDAAIEAVPAWSVRCSSSIMEDFACAVVRSNLWPGAYCFSTQKKLFQNVYLGFGLKYMEHNFSPVALPPVQQDYPIGAEIMELMDPTGAEEEKWRIDHLPKVTELALMGEELEEEEAEEEEEPYN